MSSTEPGIMYAGDNITWLRDLPDYLAPGYVLNYALSNINNAIKFVATNESGKHRINLAAADTAKWSPGRYDWVAYVSDGAGDRKVIDTGICIVKTDPNKGQPVEGRSHARKMLDAIEAALEQRATVDQLDMIRGVFGQRAIERGQGNQGQSALILARDKYKAEVEAEEQAAALARGESLGGKLYVRFNR